MIFQSKQISPNIKVRKSSAKRSQASPKKQIIVIRILCLWLLSLASCIASLKQDHIKLKINPILHVYTSVFISDRPVNYITFTSLCLFRVLRMGDYNPKILNCECPKYRFVDEADYIVSDPYIHTHSSLN